MRPASRISRVAYRVSLTGAAAFLALSTLAGCHEQRSAPTHPVRWVNAWISALNSHSLAQIGPLFAPQGTYEDPLSSGPRSGKSLAYLLTLRFSWFPNSHYELTRVTAEGNRLAIEWEATDLGIATRGVPLKGVFVLQVQDNAIASVRAYFDPRAFPLGNTGPR